MILPGRTDRTFFLCLFFLLIKFDKYLGLDFLNYSLRIIPVFPATRQFDYKGIAYLYTKFPVQLVYTITIHKNQGLILSKTILNLNQREYCLGLSYITISRVKILSGILFEVLFDFDCSKHINSAVSVDTELDYTISVTEALRQILGTTDLHL
jgi:hypothetical protein